MAMHYVYDIFDREQMLSINLLTLGVVSGLTAAVLWGAMEWYKGYQLANYRKDNGDNQ